MRIHGLHDASPTLSPVAFNFEALLRWLGQGSARLNAEALETFGYLAVGSGPNHGPARLASPR